jgi:hypothetical protein
MSWFAAWAFLNLGLGPNPSAAPVEPVYADASCEGTCRDTAKSCTQECGSLKGERRSDCVDYCGRKEKTCNDRCAGGSPDDSFATQLR